MPLNARLTEGSQTQSAIGQGKISLGWAAHGLRQELNVTQAAISRMVRLLEARLGIELFERLPNGLVLTAQAEALKPSLRRAALDSIAASVEQVVAMRTTPVLTIGVGPSFAMRWMIPRLASFYGTHPDIEVRLATGGAINPFKDDWTCGILLGNGDWPGLAAEPLFSANLFPVCTAAIAQRLGKPSDLVNESLLQVVHSPEDWPLWLAAAGVKLRRKALGPSFANYGMALQAALDGVGVAIGLRPYVEDDIAMRRLVAPFAISVPQGAGLVSRLSSVAGETDPALTAFRDWLRTSFQVTS